MGSCTQKMSPTACLWTAGYGTARSVLSAIAPLLVEVPGAAGVDDPLPLAPVALGALLLLVEFLALRLQSGQDIEQVGLLRLGRYKVLKRILDFLFLLLFRWEGGSALRRDVL